ncbi:VPA1269 family protein [Endozoicomonas gorgoniicola]|uniref:VPA1269 family protein n=1 Tax=Endozoicomonas gorgoniicola TaxID=1234144 RepID=A0ABT3MP12_9GAMM|nr:VPA1269 family protein [Endozoicomonas gorgoniicola]MCW7551106.1 VPA1269 family protein [Endozoicomonas gorgoniicola]MCW7556011.1 VPA1269 family protein [Endozoicomonas gorgoniicola]
MSRKRIDNRTTDLSCSWLTKKYGKEWELWREYAENWLHSIKLGLTPRLQSVVWFLETYIVKQELSSEPLLFLNGDCYLPKLFPIIEQGVKSNGKYTRNNQIVEFIDWVIVNYFSEPDDNGKPIALFQNPFTYISEKGYRSETVYNPIPYRYIKELRSILCPDPNGHFSNWTWAQEQSGKNVTGNLGDWYEVTKNLIDTNDPDCVWRKIVVEQGQYYSRNGKRYRVKRKNGLEIYQMWSPVRPMILFIKLHLPLRTYQVRMLDSGEADTWRYLNGTFKLNKQNSFVLGSKKNPYSKGVFRRLISPDTGNCHTALYINTNKTADQNKAAIDRGYTIPWEHEQVLYWLEKLRNWQEKYNPIESPTPWSCLQKKHTSELKSEALLEEIGKTCFLFRNASATISEDKMKPLCANNEANLWYRLLFTLESTVKKRNGEALLRFVKPYGGNIPISQRYSTEFPLHSLRVSLLTHYAMDGEVPIPVLSKLVAGHSRLIMTLYYIKISPAVMRQKMDEAESKIEAEELRQLSNFLTDATIQQIKEKAIFRDYTSLEMVLVNRNPAGWEQRHIGLCLAGGNTVKSDETNLLAGCWNGGECKNPSARPRSQVYDPVPHGPENCCRCRWFITDSAYLDALRGHFNNLSYHASLAAKLAIEAEQIMECLEDERSSAEDASMPFRKQSELQQAQRRYEKQLVEADEYAKDMRACFTLIHRIINLEESRKANDNKQKLVAVGKLHDIYQPIALLETQSELLQLSGICEDAEVYPELADDLRKTPAIEKRSNFLDSALIREGYQPIFITLNEKMQLMVGNSLMRIMAKQACPDDWQLSGMKTVCSIIEAKQSLYEAGFLNVGIEALEKSCNKTMFFLRDIISNNHSSLCTDYDDVYS